MNAALRFLLLATALAAAAWLTRRRDRADRPVPVLWRFGANLRTATTGWNALWFGGAVLSTVLLVVTGADRALQDLWQDLDPLPSDLLWGMLRLGEYWTLALALGLLGVGVCRRLARTRLAGAVAIQALLCGLVVTLALKMLTGRRGPLDPERTRIPPFPKVEDAADFAFDFWNRAFPDGRFFWPSGHTLSSMVVVTALVAAFPRRRWIAPVGYPVVVFMGVSMIDGDFHWTSDVLAAVLIGLPLGRAIGRRLRAEHDTRTGDEAREAA